MGNKNIVIKDNHFFSDYLGDIGVSWADGDTVSGNTFSPPAGAKLSTPVSVRDSRNVRIGSNILRQVQDFGAARRNKRP